MSQATKNQPATGVSQYVEKTLSSFQDSEGIPLEQQIILLNNERLFAGFDPVIYPYFKVGKFQRTLESLKMRFSRPYRNKDVSILESSTMLYLGYFDNSYDYPSQHLGKLFELLSRFPERDFNLLIGKGDYQLDKTQFSNRPENLRGIWANNVNLAQEGLHFLPIGRDFRNLEYLNQLRPQARKKRLCYCNYSLDTHYVRRSIYSVLMDKPFIDFEHMGAFLAYPISRQKFLQRVSESKFCVCPRGNAIDTFRLWDCLYAGTVPIVVKEAVFHDRMTDLPILFLDDASEFSDLTEDYLESAYSEFKNKSFNYEKLTFSYWLEARA